MRELIYLLVTATLIVRRGSNYHNIIKQSLSLMKVSRIVENEYVIIVHINEGLKTQIIVVYEWKYFTCRLLKVLAKDNTGSNALSLFQMFHVSKSSTCINIEFAWSWALHCLIPLVDEHRTFFFFFLII